MRKLSRWMLQAPERRVVPARAVLLAAAAVALVCLAISMRAFVTVTGLMLLGALVSFYERRRLRRLAGRRAGEGICTFARSFDRRAVDPRIVRAVYEEFQAYFDGELPVRAADRIEEDLRMDWEDVDDLVRDAASRAGRTLERAEENPFHGQMRNVGDLVLFLMYQPERGAS